MSSIALVYFSPTGNSKKAVSSIGELPCVTVKTFDITGNVEVPETDLSGFDFVVFGAPVYAGRIPACSVERCKKMKGSGTPFPAFFACFSAFNLARFAFPYATTTTSSKSV